MTGIHGLEHIQRLSRTAFPYDNPVRSHAQGIDDQVTYGHLPTPLRISGPSLHPDHVSLRRQLELKGILDGHHALIGADKTRERVQERGLATARTS